ncbi:protein of unknown function [Paraburkholderia kururiensis]
MRRLFDFSLALSLGYYVVYPEGLSDSGAKRAMRDWLLAQRNKDGQHSALNSLHT